MLQSEIEDIRSGIKTGRFANEAAVRQGIILRLLQSLAWPTYDTQVVAPEYSVEGTRVDYALCHPPGKPVVFIEVKHIGKSDGGERQLFEYAFHRGVPMAILTDGQEWHFFLPAEQGDYGERRVYKLDIVERDIVETIARLKRYLDYRAIRSGEAISAARADYQNVARERLIEKTFPDAWHRLVEDEDELLLELIADRVESLCGYKPNPDTVAEFLKKRVDLKSATTQPSVYPPVQPVTSLPPPISPPPIHPLGRVGFTLNGRFQPSRNARDVLAKVFIEFADRNSTFLERFASLPKHGRTRRYLARTPNELYPERPDLARDFSQEIKPGWWLGINLSRAAIYRIIRMACEVAGLRFDTDIKVDLGD